MAPIPRGLLTLEEWDALPEDNSARCELQEGVLIISPSPARKHQRTSSRLQDQIEAHCPPGWEVLHDFDLLVKDEAPPTVRKPDLIVARYDESDTRALPGEVALVVEIISPGSRTVDLHLKTFEYADAGVPHYWVVDLEPPVPSVTVLGLGAPGDGYVESQRGVTGELVVAEPFPMTVDVKALIGPPRNVSRTST